MNVAAWSAAAPRDLVYPVCIDCIRAPSPPPNRFQKVSVPGASGLPARPADSGLPQPDKPPASAIPAAAPMLPRRNARREVVGDEGTIWLFSCGFTRILRRRRRPSLPGARQRTEATAIGPEETLFRGSDRVLGTAGSSETIPRAQRAVLAL